MHISSSLRVNSSVLALACIIAGTSTAAAQTASAPQEAAGPQDPAAPSDAEVAEGEIVVSGFRASLQSALNTKREATVQVDAINAEDIADFPDTNLAESLQRLPGVSIDRDNGEGRGITVRGLGGDFNRTRLNGLEALATAGANDNGSSPNRSRSFDYNTFASELFNSLKVQKTPSAETDEGSLGATIDLQTGRPFDYKKATFALSAEGSYQKNSKEWSPRIAGLASTRFAGGDMGILISGAYSKSSNELDQYRRGVGQSDYLYRGSTWAGNESPPRAGFSAPVGTTFGTNITNPDALAFQTGSDPAAYAKLYPGAPFNTPGRFDDSLVRIPALASLEQQDVKNERLGITASYQWQISGRTRLSIDGAYSRLKNDSTYYQVSSVGLNRNNTNAAYNTAGNNLTPTAARALYPGLCTPNAGSSLVPPQDCGQELYGSTPAFATAFDQNGNRVASVLGAAAVVPGGVSPANANIFSTNPFNLDPYDYYNNPNSVGYIPSTNRLAFRGQLIGRPAVDVLDANVTNGLADYLVLRNVDFRSAADHADYVTEFKQGSIDLTHDFSDTFKVQFIGGYSESTNNQRGLLVEYNRMDSPGNFVYDERGDGSMPKIDFGFDAADPNNWETVKGFSAIRHTRRFVKNTYKQGKIDFDWQANDELNIGFGGNYREYSFNTSFFERNTDTLNPTLREAGVATAQTGRVIQFGQGLNVPAGTLSSFYAPDIDKFDAVFDFTCNCVNKWGDWRLTNRRNGGRENFGVTEKDTGLYFQLDWNSELFGRPFRGNAGTRIAITDITSNGTTQAGRPIVGKNRYTDYLPSINAVYEPIDDVLVRLSASRVMARPLLGNLSPTITAISVPNTGDTVGATLTVGNPQLEPFRSTNYDASIEWYFAKGGLLSLALFQKDIESFPQTIFYTAQLSQFADAATIAAIREQFTNLNQLAYLDNNYPFTARQFRDAPGGYLRGLEASFQMDFTFLPGLLKNFGVQANYTYIKSELNYILDPGTTNALGQQVVPQTLGKGPFLGVSPQAFNATLYYESDRLRARVSVANRKGFSATYPIASGSCSPGITNPTATGATVCDGPLVNDFVYTRGTTNVDASMSYKLTDWFSISAEGLNLTNQTSDQYAYQGQEAVSRYASSGPIYRVGARLRF
ncbi:TonB-dependent receptor [Sphingomonas turrisvirgatae]|uniref:TonB-dependent receptor n=1 Tax=Sphingomonas turrisvirgatae TaxID=1888892 RepID=A0A1E3LVP1_9SPHN|nr:TonB-dependent receptor [Sphingomonas turrisvirgatae]ODP37826.1 TonB-dependent receptor [Sphingomonas turrisvirgatae]